MSAFTLHLEARLPTVCKCRKGVHDIERYACFIVCMVLKLVEQGVDALLNYGL